MRSVSLLLALSLCLAPVSALAQRDRKVRPGRLNVLERTKRSVVTITSDKGVLSGFFVGSGSTILTSAHGVYDATSLQVKDFDGHTWAPKSIAIDGGADLALLKLVKTSSCPPLRIQPASMRLSSGDSIYVVGNPLGFLDSTVTNGIVSGTRLVKGVPHLQITAPISHGSSGSPVINEKGYVVGLVKGAIEEGQALNFAVAAKQIRSFVFKPAWTDVEQLYAFNHANGGAISSDEDENKAAGVARVVIVISIAKTLYDLSVAEAYQFNYDVEGSTMRGWEDTTRLKKAIEKASDELGELKSMDDIEEEYPNQDWHDSKVNDLLTATDEAVEAMALTPKQLSVMEQSAKNVDDPDSKAKFDHNWDLVSSDLDRIRTLLTKAIARDCEEDLLDALDKSKVGKYMRMIFSAPGVKDTEDPFLPDIEIGEMVVRLPYNSGAWTSDLRPQDTVLAVDGEKVDTLHDLERQLDVKKPAYRLKVERDGKEIEVELRRKSSELLSVHEPG